ncbi:PAS domain S-box protein [Candidatus Bipolaricaulota bacterium]|nr:PAS domain S-box protein [Candidatus Bipolaricaulota bacterium]
MTPQECSEPEDVSFAKLAETSPAAITRVDKDGHIVYANEKAKEVLGLEESEITDRTYDDVSWKITDLEGEEFPQGKLPFQTVKNTEEPVSNVKHAIELPNKQRKFLSVNASPLFDDDGNFDGMVAFIEDITKREQIKENLTTSEQRYRRLFETAQDGMLILEADSGKIMDANPYIRNLLGFSKQELVGKQLWEIGTFKDVVENRDKFQKLVKEGYIRYEHLPLKTKDGKEALVEFVSNSYMVNGQKVIQCNIRDITERRKAERKLKESERKYRSLFKSIRDALLVADMDRNIIDCNPAFTELFGYELEEIEGKKTEYVYHDSEEYEQMGEEIEESIGDPNFFYTVHYEKKNGEIFPGETNVFYLREDGGEVIGFIGLIRDITEKHKRQEELEQSEKRYRTLFETTGTTMLIIEEDTTISLINKEVEKLSGYSKDEVEGKMSWTELVAEEDDLQKMKKYHTLRRKDPASAPTQYEFKLLDKDGNEKDVFMTIDVIPDTKKSVASIIDITEKKNYEQKLRQSFIELAETTSRVLGVRDPYTQEHEQRVAELAQEVGRRIGVEEEEQLGLYLGGILHDIGKVAVPTTILTKPGKLKEVEWKMIKSHPKVGYNKILKDTHFPWPVAEMTLHHHERLDGSGYPDGLEGDQLSLEVRILGAVDVVEAMSTRRPYREARSKEKTLNVIKQGREDKFDPQVVDILVEMIEEGEIEFGRN